MGEDQGQVGAAVEREQKRPDEIREEIEDTRQDLGDTAAALAAKTDVKARAKEKVEGVKQTIAAKRESLGSSSSSGDTDPGAGSEGGVPARANAAVAQAKTKAQENPVPTAAIAAFVGGFVLGRLTSRAAG
jgi:ElaB/YqjD/DUF883 family membrane-anchored ribosome-binding protein